MKPIFSVFATLLMFGLLLSIYLRLTMHSEHNIRVSHNPPTALIFTSETTEMMEKRNTVNRKLSEPNQPKHLNNTIGYMLMHKPKHERKHPQDIPSNSKHNLCLFIWATTYTKQHAQELRDIMDIYRSRDDVYFIMDHLRGVLQYEICNIPGRCVFIEYDMNSPYKLSKKTISALQYIYDRKLYNKCNWIMKTDTDSYVDMDRFSDFLTHNYNANDYHYFGHPVSCEADILMAQGGGYLISKAVLRDYEWNFSAMAPTEHSIMGMEDCMVAVMLYKQLNLKVNTFNNAGFFMRNEIAMENEWEKSKLNYAKWGLTGCTFVWHKVTQAFRLKLVGEVQKQPYHTNHCKRIARKGMEYRNGTLFIKMS
eukprot:207314_1